MDPEPGQSGRGELSRGLVWGPEGPTPEAQAMAEGCPKDQAPLSCHHLPYPGLLLSSQDTKPTHACTHTQRHTHRQTHMHARTCAFARCNLPSALRHDELQVLDSGDAKVAVTQQAELEEEAAAQEAAKEADKAAAKKAKKQWQNAKKQQQEEQQQSEQSAEQDLQCADQLATSRSDGSTQQQQQQQQQQQAQAQQAPAGVDDDTWHSNAKARETDLVEEATAEEAVKAAAKMAKKQRQTAKKQQQQQQHLDQDQNGKGWKDSKLLQHDEQGTGKPASEATSDQPTQDRLQRLSLLPLDMPEQARSARRGQAASVEAAQAPQHVASVAVSQPLSPNSMQTSICGQLHRLQTSGDQPVQSEFAAVAKLSKLQQAMHDLLCCPLTKVMAGSADQFSGWRPAIDTLLYARFSEMQGCLLTMSGVCTLQAVYLILMQRLTKEPVIAADGYTYEKHAFQEWLQQYTTLPVTGQAVSSPAMISNLAIMDKVKSSGLPQ